MRRYIIVGLICVLLVCLCCAFVPAYAETAEEGVKAAETELENDLLVTGADILRGARNNVNRESLMLNPTVDGLVIGGSFEKEKGLVKVAIKKGIPFSEVFSLNCEILRADSGCTMDIGFLYGDIDEAWLDPWDFLGIDMNDPGSLAKFQNIGGLTIRFSMSGDSVSTVMMKGIGTDLNQAAFAVAGVTQMLPFAQERDINLKKESENWTIFSCGYAIPMEENATFLNPAGNSEASQVFLNRLLNSLVGKEVYAFACLSKPDAAETGEASLCLTQFGDKQITVPMTDDPLLGDVSYEKNPANKIEFSVIENYYVGLDEYADRNFTYLSQPYQNPSYQMTQNGLRLSGRDKLYGVNADLTYMKAYERFDGFSAVLSAGYMPQSTSAVNSCITLALNGKKFASYYAWNSIYIKIAFPLKDVEQGLSASILLWGEPTALGNTLLAEMPTAQIPWLENGDIVVKIAQTDGNYYIYVNGVRFGNGYESVLKETIERIETGYTDAEGEHCGFYVSTMNTTAYFANGASVDDSVLSQKPEHYLKQINGAMLVNEQPTLKLAQAPYAPDKDDVTKNSIRLSFSSEFPDRSDGNFTVDGYLIERYIGDKKDATLLLKGVENRTFTDTGLKEGTHYTYRVYAVQGAETESPVKLVAYAPIVVKTLGTVKSPLAAGTLGWTDGLGIGLGIGIVSSIAVAAGYVLFGTRRRKKCVGDGTTARGSENRVSAVGGKRPAWVKLTIGLLCVCIGMGTLSGCAQQILPDNTGGNETDEILIDTFENMTNPLWKSGVVYNETVLMLKDGENMPTGKLAFKPKKVISVRNYSLTKTYREQEDYVIDAEGNIVLTENSECPYLKAENLFYVTRPNGIDGLYEFPSSSSFKPNLMYTETAFYVENQLCVTYEYDTQQFDTEKVSKADTVKLPALRSALEEKKSVRMAVLGDSISEGANSSAKLNIAPYQPTYSSLFRQYLEKTYGVDILFENYSMGGMNSEWGASRAYAVGQFMPDIVLLSFGANDGGTGTDNSVTPVSVESFKKNILAAIQNIRKYNPNCEFILVSSLMPNPASGAFGIQSQYAQAMNEIAQTESSIVAVDMYSMHEYFIKDCKKNYIDLSSNNINHPNDFLIRLYTMNIVSALFE